MKKRILGIVLIICMVLTFVPTIVFADDATYLVVGCSELCGTTWETSPDNIMELQADGTYKKTYTSVAIGNSYMFNIVRNSNGVLDWYGTADGKTLVFNVESVCDVTITFDPSTNEITVTGAGVKIPTELNIESMCAVGSGTGNWLNGVSWDPASVENKMTEVSPKVYEITYANVEKVDECQVKFTANGSWDKNWGGNYVGSGVESVAEFDSNNNITFNVPYDFSDITLRLDLTNFDYNTKTGATFKVTIVESHEHVDSDNNDICDVCGADISFIITGRILTEEGNAIVGDMTGLANYKKQEEVILTVPVITGYNFVGWYEYSVESPYYTGESLCSSRTYKFTAEANRDLVAVYMPLGSAELTINGGTNFTINGETKSTEIKATYPMGSQITVVCNSDDFEYWKNSAGMVVSRDKSYTFTVTGKEIVSAVFNNIAANKATVQFESYYGQVIARGQYEEGAILAEEPGLPLRYGYTALGWDYNGDGTYNAETDTFAAALTRGFAASDYLVKILPVYQLDDFTYQITVEGGTGTGNYNQNDVVTVVANEPDEGMKFICWKDEYGNILSYNVKYQFYAASDITVKAVYVTDTEEVEVKGTTKIINMYSDTINGKIAFVSMSTVPEGCTINKAGIIATDDQNVAESGDGFNAESARYVRGNAWTGNAYRFTWYKSNVGPGDIWYVRSYLVYTDAEGNVNTVYGDMESMAMDQSDVAS